MLSLTFLDICMCIYKPIKINKSFIKNTSLVFSYINTHTYIYIYIHIFTYSCSYIYINVCVNLLIVIYLIFVFALKSSMHENTCKIIFL
jgi:hypothetical protein